jgi:hypothetical protein
MNRPIRNHDREFITKKALASFDLRFDELKQREHALALAAYHSIYSQEERDLVAACPDNWFRKDNCLDFNVAGLSMRLQTGGEGLPVPYKNKNGSDGYGCNPRGVIQAGELADKILALADDGKALNKERAKAKAALMAMLAKVSSLKKLQEIWPEGKPFYALLETAQTQSTALALPISDINKMLGIAA